ncbi:Eco47II family restriction endonuclease [Sedimentibacter sp. zth1]|uniref:Eco47II family restriction endonuclease n=1 Tax=Sedimentibacter sp. zth1 TaxID=2816908 RepID=UPI001F5EA7BB|nr:Eco47II family restriction endonuclease [Sedimentibacter sp. zth1]
MYDLDFISQENFEKHVANTIKEYKDVLKSIDITKFNRNIIDPIKLLFDKNVFRTSFEEIIDIELHRQRDKSNNNSIGYFHQNIFKYINNCTVPKQGWDVIVKIPNEPIIYVEMKNKHNTMNSSSAQKTYLQMQNQILHSPNDICYLVEVISKCSRNISWGCSVNHNHLEDERIRKVSIDKFYEIVTGDKDAFCKLCMQLPKTIEKLISNSNDLSVQQDTVVDGLKNINPDMLKALYLLAFNTYEGFNSLG